jgi:hypothetical protein
MPMNDTFRWIVVVFLATHIPATIMMDSQALVPAKFVPKFARSLLEFHVNANHDPLMEFQPVWFKSLIAFELLFQLPFFFVGCHAFYHKQNWIRVPGIVYGTHTATTLIPILAEILHSGDIPNAAARAQLFFIYLPYLVIPAMMALILCAEEKPFGVEGDKPAKRAKAKRK